MSAVDRLYDELLATRKVLEEADEISLASAAEDAVRRMMVVAGASHLERELIGMLRRVAEAGSRGEVIVEFVEARSGGRFYHQLFDWNAGNANGFFKLFGTGFKSYAERRVNAEEALAESVKAFLELGRERNRLVHGDFGAVPLEKDAEEILELVRHAEEFVGRCEGMLTTFDGMGTSGGEEE